MLTVMVVFCSACASMDSNLKNRPSPSIDIEQDKKEKKHYKKRNGERILGQNGTATEEEFRKLEEETNQFNQKLQGILSSSKGIKEYPHPSGKKNATVSEAQKVSFNFYDADLVEVIRVFMKLLNEDYVLHPNVQGQVSLAVDDSFSKNQIINLLRGVLRINNSGMIKKDQVWEIMPISEIPKNLTDQDIIFSEKGISVKRGQIIQGFRLNYIPAQEIIKIIKPYLSDNTQVYANDDRGVLLVCDYPHVLEKVNKLISIFDESVFADKIAKVYPLEYVNAKDAVENLEKISENFGLSKGKGAPKNRVSFLPLERLNMLLAIGRDKKIIEFVDTWVKQLDREVPQSLQKQYGQNIFVYYVQYGDAEDIVESIRGLFESQQVRTTEEEESGPRSGSSKSEREISEQGKALGGVSGELTGEVTFTIDKSTNAIITKCSSEDYQKVLSVIERLDQYPKQVLIKVIIAEVSLNDTSQFGIEWRYLMEHNDVEGNLQIDSSLGTFSEETAIGSGLTYTVESAHRLKAVLKASADQGETNILSTPTLLASDNQEARINIGEEVPIPTSVERKQEETSVVETTDTTIQYRDTGIILKVTPKINKYGMVQLEISQEISSLTERQVEGVTAPIISNRIAETTVSVNDGQTIVIGGLMEQEQSDNFSGVPFFRNIPVVKYFFGYQRKTFSNKELIILITPHVVLDEEDSQTITRDFLEKLERLKKSMS